MVKCSLQVCVVVGSNLQERSNKLITAGKKNIWIDQHWYLNRKILNGQKSRICIHFYIYLQIFTGQIQLWGVKKQESKVNRSIPYNLPPTKSKIKIFKLIHSLRLWFILLSPLDTPRWQRCAVLRLVYDLRGYC